MNVSITDAALEKLQQYEIPKGYGIRIDGEMAGGWGCTVEFHLALDETRKNDTVISIGHVDVFIDRFTQRYIDDQVKIDYNPVQGFSLSSPNEIFAYGLTLVQK